MHVLGILVGFIERPRQVVGHHVQAHEEHVPGGLPLLRWKLKDRNQAGAPDRTFLYGQQGDLPVVGDWDGDGTASIGMAFAAVMSLRLAALTAA